MPASLWSIEEIKTKLRHYNQAKVLNEQAKISSISHIFIWSSFQTQRFNLRITVWIKVHCVRLMPKVVLLSLLIKHDSWASHSRPRLWNLSFSVELSVEECRAFVQTVIDEVVSLDQVPSPSWFLEISSQNSCEWRFSSSPVVGLTRDGGDSVIREQMWGQDAQ